MKKILSFLVFVFSFSAAFAQTGNDTTKYTYYQFQYGQKFNRVWGTQVLNAPNDTTYSKYGLAIKAGSLYVGNGIKWNITGGGSPTSLASLSDVNLTSPSDWQILRYNNSSSKWVNSTVDSTRIVTWLGYTPPKFAGTNGKILYKTSNGMYTSAMTYDSVNSHFTMGDLYSLIQTDAANNIGSIYAPGFMEHLTTSTSANATMQYFPIASGGFQDGSLEIININGANTHRGTLDIAPDSIAYTSSDPSFTTISAYFSYTRNKTFTVQLPNKSSLAGTDSALISDVNNKVWKVPTSLFGSGGGGGSGVNSYPRNALHARNDSTIVWGGSMDSITVVDGGNTYPLTFNNFAAATGRGFRVNFGSDAGWDIPVRDSATGFWTRIPKGTVGQVLTMSGSGGIAWANPSGGGGTLSASNFVVRETPSGTLNGTNVTFTLANTPTSGTEQIFLNGQLLTLTTDYTISSATITMIIAPVSTDKLRVTYMK